MFSYEDAIYNIYLKHKIQLKTQAGKSHTAVVAKVYAGNNDNAHKMQNAFVVTWGRGETLMFLLVLV